MTSILIATAQALLRYDTETNQTFIVQDANPLYYGISWFPNSDRMYLSHSGGSGNLASIEAYMRSEVGFISESGQRTSPQLLSNPHQIRCLTPPFIAATNTGRNSIIILNSTDWSTRQIRFDDVHWDRFDPAGQGSHFNSVEFDGNKLYVLAHNFDAGSYELQITWPDLASVTRRSLPGQQLHNLWYRDNDTHISCDSPNGGLVELNTGRQLWRHDGQKFYTRGLASNGKHIFVGATEIAPRDEREFRISRIIVLDAESYRLEDMVELGPFGDVCEVRIIDEFDLCHPVGPLSNTHLLAQNPHRQAAVRENIRRPVAIGGHEVRSGLADIVAQRDQARDVATEALAQRDRLSRERSAMLIERDAAITARDEAVAQQNRLQKELTARIEERDIAVRARDHDVARRVTPRHEPEPVNTAQGSVLRHLKTWLAGQN